MLQLKYLLGVAIGLSSIGLITSPSLGLSAPEVAKIAKNAAVTIVANDSHGSGIIIQHQGNQYLVLTAAHVVNNQQINYQIITPDDLHYQLQPTAIQIISGVDLAIVKFTSDKNYPVPKLGNADNSTEGTTIYVSGFPLARDAINRSIFNFTDGKVTANSSKPLKDGYSIIYSNNTLPGMSGGGVFNDRGELVAIHGKGDVDTKITTSEINPNIRVKTGFNLGIPINTFQQLASKLGINVGTQVASANPSPPKADDFVVSGFDRVSKNDLAGSVVEFTKAIELKPNLVTARFWRGACLLLMGDAAGAIADLTKTIALNPKKLEAYMYRGSAYAKLGNRTQALADLDRAVSLNPQSDVAYGNRCSLKFQLRDFQGAIADCDRAIQINPYDRFYYSSRGSTYFQLDRFGEALTDLNTAIKLNPKEGTAYVSRGVTRVGLGDFQGAIRDYNLALRLETRPRIIAAIYSTRGQAKYRNRDFSGAIADLTEALNLTPNNYEIYFFRGNTYYQSGDSRRALADLDRAIKLKPKSAESYLLRGVIRTEVNQTRQALTDFDTVLKINSSLTTIALAQRGIAKAKLGDRQGAIADYNRSISLAQDLPTAYYHRGLLKISSGDKQGAIVDLETAAKLYFKLNNTEKYRVTMDKIAELTGKGKE